MISLLGLYRPRRTPMHLAPAWFKVLLLFTISIACLMVSDVITSIGITVACLLLLASTVPPAKATIKGMAVISLIALLTTIFQLLRGEWVRAIDLAGDLISIAALALAVSCSTSMADMLDLIATLARPLKWILPPDTIGIMVSIALRTIPEGARILNEARVAARARGMDRDPRAVLIPSTTRSVGFALQLGQALHARGIAETGRQRRADRHAERDAREARDTAHAEARANLLPPIRENVTDETPVVRPAARNMSRRARRESRGD